MRQTIRIPAFISGAVVVAVLGLALVLDLHDARAAAPDNLLRLLPENVESLVYFKDLKEGLTPFLRSQYYKEVGGLALFDGPMKSDLSAPILTKLGNFEKSTGIRPTPRRLLWMVGTRAIFFTAGTTNGRGSAGIVETGSFKSFIITVVSIFSGGVAKEDWGGYSVWVLTSGDRHIYYKTTKGYTVFSDSPDLFKDQWERMTGTGSSSLLNNAGFKTILSRLGEGYHILYYSTAIMNPDPEKKGLRARAARLLKGTDALAAAVTFTETGLDAKVVAPYSAGEDKSGLAALGMLPDRPAIDLGQFPAETAALIAFRAFDAGIIYSHFNRTWFGDVTERMAYTSTVNTWKEKGGFDLETGIINNLGRGATVAITGLGWEGKKPHLKVIASVGVRPGGEAELSENISKLFTYSFFDAGPQVRTLGNAALSFMGEFREKNATWNGTGYDVSVASNPGFAFWGPALYLFWDLSAIQRFIDNTALSTMKGVEDLFDRDFLVKSSPFIEAQKKIYAGDWDLYTYVDGNNAVSLLENYLVNLSANYTYFLYQDSEKRLLPLLELTRRGFVSCSGGVNFAPDAIEGTFTLTTKDIDE